MAVRLWGEGGGSTCVQGEELCRCCGVRVVGKKCRETQLKVYLFNLFS